MGLGLLVVIVAGMLLFNFIKTQQGKSTQVVQEQKPEVPGQPVVSTPTSHKVVPGENLWVIAEKYYQSGYNWVNIAEANKISNPNLIEVSQTLEIPKVETITVDQGSSTTSKPEVRIEGEDYTIAKGDDLWHIAVRTYGDGYAWVKIAQANNLSNPNLIHSGNVLNIPR